MGCAGAKAARRNQAASPEPAVSDILTERLDAVRREEESWDGTTKFYTHCSSLPLVYHVKLTQSDVAVGWGEAIQRAPEFALKSLKETLAQLFAEHWNLRLARMLELLVAHHGGWDTLLHKSGGVCFTLAAVIDKLLEEPEEVPQPVEPRFSPWPPSSASKRPSVQQHAAAVAAAAPTGDSEAEQHAKEHMALYRAGRSSRRQHASPATASTSGVPRRKMSETRAREHMMMYRASREQQSEQADGAIIFQPSAKQAFSEPARPVAKHVAASTPKEPSSDRELRSKAEWLTHLDVLRKELIEQHELLKVKASKLKNLMEKRAKSFWGM